MDKYRFKELWQEMRKDLQDNDASEYSVEAWEWAVMQTDSTVCGRTC